MPKKVFSETKLYPVVIHRDGDVWGYFSPQFGGGSASTQADALQLSQELFSTAVNEFAEIGEEVPAPLDADSVEADGGTIAWLPVVVSNVAERVVITLPKALVAKIDAATNNRSVFFAELAR